MLPRVLPFVILLIGVMVALYGGYATPSETAGLGAVLALVLIAVIYGVWRPRDVEPILVGDAEGIDHADVHHRHVAAVLLRDELPAHQPVGGAVDRRACTCRSWLLLAAILLLVVVLGFFLPPVSHHPDDRADHPAAAQGRRLRPDLVRRA